MAVECLMPRSIERNEITQSDGTALRVQNPVISHKEIGEHCKVFESDYEGEEKDDLFVLRGRCEVLAEDIDEMIKKPTFVGQKLSMIVRVCHSRRSTAFRVCSSFEIERVLSR
jgi:hypothetical protein